MFIGGGMGIDALAESEGKYTAVYNWTGDPTLVPTTAYFLITPTLKATMACSALLLAPLEGCNVQLDDGFQDEVTGGGALTLNGSTNIYNYSYESTGLHIIKGAINGTTATCTTPQMIAVVSGTGGNSAGVSAGCGATITPITPVSITSSNLEPNYSKASDNGSKKQNVRDIFGYMDVDTVVPSANDSISFTGAVGGGANGTGYWGNNSTFIWNESIGGGHDQRGFCPGDIDTFTPDIPSSITAGRMDSISLCVVNSQDNNATFSTGYIVTYHNAAENIVTTSTTPHPIVPISLSGGILIHDPADTQWIKVGALDGANGVTPSWSETNAKEQQFTETVSCETSSTGSVGVDVAKEEIQIKIGITDSTVVKCTTSQTNSLTGVPGELLYVCQSPMFTLENGTFDGYGTKGYGGIGTWSATQSSGAIQFTTVVAEVY
jgi:hypothetical protein